jgi:hypothetical protein
MYKMVCSLCQDRIAPRQEPMTATVGTAIDRSHDKNDAYQSINTFTINLRAIPKEELPSPSPLP